MSKALKFAFIAAALSWTETPDTDGLFLQPEEAAKIDKDLEEFAASKKAAEDLATANTTIGELTTTITGLNNTVADMKTAADTATHEHANAISAKDTRIQELEGQVKELGGKSSGNGTVITTKEDEIVADKGVNASGLPRFDSPDHPANQVADRYTRKRD